MILVNVYVLLNIKNNRGTTQTITVYQKYSLLGSAEIISLVNLTSQSHNLFKYKSQSEVSELFDLCRIANSK